MRQANKREKKQLRQREIQIALTGIEPTTLSIQSEFCSRIPPRLTRKIC